MKLQTLLFCLAVLGLTACSEPEKQPLHTEAPQPSEIKNIIVLLGDGMGPQQVALGAAYRQHISKTPFNILKLLNEGEVGVVSPEGGTNLVIDSACSASQLATGEYCRPEMLGLNMKGEKVQTILERAAELGKSTGLVSDTRITHATPAAFAAHIGHRRYENQIAEQLLAANVDVMLSGGLRHFVPSSVKNPNQLSLKNFDPNNPAFGTLKSKRKDDKNLLAQAHTQGYDLVFERRQLCNKPHTKLLGLFASSGLPDAIAMREKISKPKRQMPTLAEMARCALATLEQNPNGFFLMLEAGQIDWAGHENDAGRMLHEMLRFDEAVGVVLDWVATRSDTLVLITADHETGSFGFSYSARDIPESETIRSGFLKPLRYQPRYNFGRRESLEKLHAQSRSLFDIVQEFNASPLEDQSPERLQTMVNTALPFTLSLNDARNVLRMETNRYYVQGHSKLGERYAPLINDFSAFYPYIDNNRVSLIARALAEQQDVVWGTGTHTSTPVILGAHGPKHIIKAFDGYQSMTTVGKKLFAVLGESEKNE